MEFALRLKDLISEIRNLQNLNNFRDGLDNENLFTYKKNLYYIHQILFMLDFLKDYDSISKFNHKKIYDYFDYFKKYLKNQEIYLDEQIRMIYDKIEISFDETIKKYPLKYICYLSEVFSGYKNDENLLFYVINILPKENINNLILSYGKNAKKVNELRYNVLTKLNEEVFFGYEFEDLMEKVNHKYETNIFKSWSIFSILMPFFYDGATKTKVSSLIEIYLKNLKSKLGNNSLKDKWVGFEGSNNFGTTRFWFALYNQSYESQFFAKQLFFSVDYNSSNVVNIEYGLLDRQNNEFKNIVKCNSYQSFKEYDLLDNFKNNLVEIENDESGEMDETSFLKKIDDLDFDFKIRENLVEEKTEEKKEIQNKYNKKKEDLEGSSKEFYNKFILQKNCKFYKN